MSLDIQQKLQQAQSQQALDVKFTPQDAVKCECTNMTFQQVFIIMKKNNPIVGQPALKAGIPKFQCTHCGKLMED